MRFTLDFADIDRSHLALVGGKGAHLGELARIRDISVPAGFCVTTDAYRRLVADDPAVSDHLGRLAGAQRDDRAAIHSVSADVRRAIEAIQIPDDLAIEIAARVAKLGRTDAYAVRSSATAEDLPTASFAGQQDTYLNVVGTDAIIEHVRRCWASLYTERAVTYRLRNGIDQRTVRMAVVVQRMLFPRSSGILFTADPITGNRKVSSIDAGFGLGEALVAGLVNPDVFKVRDDVLISRTIATKQGDTAMPSLTDAEAIRLAQLGRRIESHFGRPQDIEWCLTDDAFQIVQSRPITTLFPIPVTDDGEHHVYVSTGHQQMMTDPMTPLGISVRQLTSVRPMPEAAGRLFVDITRELASPAIRTGIVTGLGRSDPLIGDALQAVVDRDFVPLQPDAPSPAPPPGMPGNPPSPLETDPAIVTELIASREDAIRELEREIRTRSGVDLIDFIITDLAELQRALFAPRSHLAVMAGMEATWWINDNLLAWLGEKGAADVLTQSVPNNVTSEMGLALLDVADVIRPYPDVVRFLEQTTDDDFLDALPAFEGGREARDAIAAWLDRYGMRCVGEIDITRPRWSERPTTILPALLGNVAHFQPGEARRRFERGLREAESKERDVLERLRALPDGEQKADETKRMIDRLRTFSGYREYPKYGIVVRYWVYKRALLAEAERLVQAGVVRERDDIYYLTLPELREAVRSQRVDASLIRERRAAYVSYWALTPPRVLTSEGECVAGSYHRDDLPAGALVGLAVSAGLVEGRARVVHDIAEAELEPGDILVTAYTDPSWTPLFVAIAGIVTEVGGLMTHGAVIAREYGLPAVVGVENATRLIRDGQRIRVHGTEGYVELLE